MSEGRFTIWHKLAALVVVVAMGAGGFTAWKWVRQVTLREIAISGMVNANERDILDLMRIDSGMVMVDLNPSLLEDRVVRHPWVEQASVSRLPSGKLVVRVTERSPVALHLDGSGRARHWIDRHGYRMPPTRQASYDVPLISGRLEAWHPLKPIADPSVMELVEALGRATPELDAILSEFIRGEHGWEARLTAAGKHASIPVILGEVDIQERLDGLLAFWTQQVLTHQNTEFELIDLRFDGRITVTEHPREEVH